MMAVSKSTEVRMMQGNEACAEGALRAGLEFFAGYPITPSSEIAEYLAVRLPRRGGKFIQMEDEIAAMAAVIGASLMGAKSMTATSGPGFSLKQENLGYAAMAEIPCVVVNVQRGGPSTGLPTQVAQGDLMQARWGTHGDHPAIVLSASGVLETFTQTVRAFNLSERFRTPVILLLDEIVGHINEKVVLPGEEEIEVLNRRRPTVPPEQYLPYAALEDGVPPMANFGEGYRYHVTGLMHDETGFPTTVPEKVDHTLRRINSKVEGHTEEIIEVEGFELEDASVAVIAYGATARSAKRAVTDARKKGLRAGLLRPLVLWPFPKEEISTLAKNVSHLIVPELNLGQFAHEVEWAACGKTEVVKLNRVDGEPIRPAEILELIEKVG
jgi:2-oxoglutarate ferredoxin oxidoreductase subunit alpha